MNLAKISAAALIVAALASTGAMAATTTTKVVTKTTAMAHTMAKPAPVKQVVTPATVFAKGKAAGSTAKKKPVRAKTKAAPRRKAG